MDTQQTRGVGLIPAPAQLVFAGYSLGITFLFLHFIYTTEVTIPLNVEQQNSSAIIMISRPGMLTQYNIGLTSRVVNPYVIHF